MNPYTIRVYTVDAVNRYPDMFTGEEYGLLECGHHCYVTPYTYEELVGIVDAALII